LSNAPPDAHPKIGAALTDQLRIEVALELRFKVYVMRYWDPYV
jgi:hypothetical protein